MLSKISDFFYFNLRCQNAHQIDCNGAFTTFLLLPILTVNKKQNLLAPLNLTSFSTHRTTTPSTHIQHLHPLLEDHFITWRSDSRHPHIRSPHTFHPIFCFSYASLYMHGLYGLYVCMYVCMVCMYV
jgi:hypothetical protein